MFLLHFESNKRSLGEQKKKKTLKTFLKNLTDPKPLKNTKK